MVALGDLESVLPGVSVVPTAVDTDVFLSLSGTWTDDGLWLSYRAFGLPKNCRLA